jgi:DNA-binding PadR family transcriptional regulator
LRPTLGWWIPLAELARRKGTKTSFQELCRLIPGNTMRLRGSMRSLTMSKLVDVDYGDEYGDRRHVVYEINEAGQETLKRFVLIAETVLGIVRCSR